MTQQTPAGQDSGRQADIEITDEMVDAGASYCVERGVEGITLPREFVAELFHLMVETRHAQNRGKS